jgi:alginate O-acetyltransferase complex protein AlgI
VLFACEDIGAAGRMYGAMFGIGVPLADEKALFYLGGSVVMLIICTVAATRLPKCLAQKLESKLPATAFQYIRYGVILAVLLVSMAFLVADSYNPFLYFRF